MCKNFCSCFGKKKRKKRQSQISLESPTDFAKRVGPKINIDTSGLAEKTERAVETASNINCLKTNQLTDIYKLPCQKFTSVDEIVAMVGFEVSRDEVGKGATAVVYRARRLRDDHRCACKVILIANAKMAKIAKNELFIMERIRHPNIIRFLKHFIVESAKAKQAFIFLQFAEGNSLKMHIEQKESGLSEETCKRMFAQTVSAVNHMHHKGIAHRDLKLANVLLDANANCLVSDFGLSRISRTKSGQVIMIHKFDGTQQYMAPEIVLNKNEINSTFIDYDPFLVDIWALGVILFYLIYNAYPFSTPIILEELLAQQIKFHTVPKKQVFDPNTELTTLITRLLEPTIEKRISMATLMAHRWIIKDLELIEKTLTLKDKQRFSPDSNRVIITVKDNSTSTTTVSPLSNSSSSTKAIPATEPSALSPPKAKPAKPSPRPTQ